MGAFSERIVFPGKSITGLSQTVSAFSTIATTQSVLGQRTFSLEPYAITLLT
jgi:hypothetical protein